MNFTKVFALMQGDPLSRAMLFANADRHPDRKTNIIADVLAHSFPAGPGLWQDRADTKGEDTMPLYELRTYTRRFGTVSLD